MAPPQTRRHRGSKLVSHRLVVEWEAQGDPALRLAYGLLIAIGVLLTLASTAFGATVAGAAAPGLQIDRTETGLAPVAGWPFDAITPGPRRHVAEAGDI